MIINCPVAQEDDNETFLYSLTFPTFFYSIFVYFPIFFVPPADIDECQIPGTCSQRCINREGDFKCSCLKGEERGEGRGGCQVGGHVAATSALNGDFCES